MCVCEVKQHSIGFAYFSSHYISYTHIVYRDMLMMNSFFCFLAIQKRNEKEREKNDDDDV